MSVGLHVHATSHTKHCRPSLGPNPPFILDVHSREPLLDVAIIKCHGKVIVVIMPFHTCSYSTSASQFGSRLAVRPSNDSPNTF